MSTIEPPVDRPGGPTHRDATYYQVPRRRRPILAALMWSVVALLGLVGAGALFAERNLERALDNPLNDSQQVKEAVQVLSEGPKNLPDRPTNLLLIGSDRRSAKAGNGLSDTLMLVRLDFKRGFVSILSFPRDLYVEVPGYGFNKINAAYSFGREKLAIQTIQQLTGEPINHFFNVDFNAFRRLVNDAGGVHLDIDRWYYNDNTGFGENFEQLNILPGYQKLRGADALDYVRYRHGDSDLGRIARQQAFLAELKRESRSASGLNNIIDAINADVTTSLKSTSKLRSFLQFGLQVEKERIARVQVGITGQDMVNGQSILRTSQQMIRDAVDRWKNPEFLSETAKGTTAKPADVEVHVYNGGKRLGLGSEVAAALQARNYQVLFGGNAPDGFYQSTSLFYAPGKRNEAKALQQLFGPSASIVQRRDDQPKVGDVLVMVGADYAGVSTPKPPPKVKAKPDTVATTSLKRIVQGARAVTGANFLVPLKVPSGSRVVFARVYNVERGDRGKPDTLTLVLRLPRNSKLGGTSYVTITQTAMKDPPIVDTRTGTDKFGFSTFYNGKNLQRLLWQRNGMTYWITNSLDESLTDVTMRDMQQFMVRPARAKLKKGQTDTPISVTEKSRTP